MVIKGRKKIHKKNTIFLHIPKAGGSTIHYVLERIYKNSETYHIPGKNLEIEINAFKEWPKQYRAKIRLLKGHMYFGLHEYLEGNSRYFTFLRDPISRLISHYYYIKRTPNHYLYNEILAKKINLEEYLLSGITEELSNDQTRMIAMTFEERKNEISSSLMLEKAIKNIEKHFVFIGIMEKFDESLLILKKNELEKITSM